MMALEMKACCEKCESPLEMDKLAYICSYECTFCHTCSDEMNATCPNCRGELVRRPKREAVQAV